MFHHAYARQCCANVSAMVGFFGNRIGGLLVCFLLFVLGSTAAAQNAAFYQVPFESSTGTFEWDFFSGSGTGPHAPDVTNEGGAGSLSATFTPNPNDGPPFPLVTSTMNIYSGGTFPDYTAALTDLDDSGSNTTVVLQLASIGDVFSGFQLNGTAPTEFLNRGSIKDLPHGTGDAVSDTIFYWAEWQLDGDGRDSFDLTFSTIPHASFAGARIDYLTSDSVVNVTPPSAVPEPASGFAVLISAIGIGLHRRKTGC